MSDTEATKWAAGTAFVDGEFCPIGEAKISILDMGVTVRIARTTSSVYGTDGSSGSTLTSIVSCTASPNFAWTSACRGRP